MKKRLKTLLKFLFSLGLLVFVLSSIDIGKFKSIIAKSNYLWLGVAFLLFNISKLLASIRLNYYFKDLGINLSEKNAAILYYVGMFYNLFLPGGIGGDGYKIYLLQKTHAPGYKPLVQATLLDRVSGFVALAFLASILFCFSSFAKLYPLLKNLSILAAILTYPLFLYLHYRLFRRFTTHIIQTTLLGLAVQIFQLLCAFAIIKGLGDLVPMVDFLTLFLISSVVAVLPLTIGGVGAREFTFLYGLKLIGYDPTLGIAFSFLFFLITALSSAIGLLFVHNPLRNE